MSELLAIVIAMPAKVRAIDTIRAHYTPVLDNVTWAAIEAYVTSRVHTALPSVPYDEDRLLVAATRHVAWCWTRGFDLDDATLFSRDLIDVSISRGFSGLSDSSKATARSILLRLGGALVPEITPERMKALPAAPARRPYTAREQASILSWAQSQRTGARRRSAHALIALGLGAGLASNEILHTTREDVTFDSDGAVVLVRGARTREVPILTSWAPALHLAADESHPGDLLFRPGPRGHGWSLITNFVLQGDYVGVRPQTQQMRATWIIHHLNIGTHPLALVEAAGVSSFESLSRFAVFAIIPSPDDARRALRAG